MISTKKIQIKALPLFAAIPCEMCGLTLRHGFGQPGVQAPMCREKP